MSDKDKSKAELAEEVVRLRQRVQALESGQGTSQGSTSGPEGDKQSYRLFFDHLHDNCLLFDVIFDDNGQPVDYLFADVNLAYQQSSGLSRDMLIGKSAFAVFPNFNPEWISFAARVATTGTPHHGVYRVRRFEKIYEIYVYRPRPGQIAGVGKDITERKRAEMALEQSQAQYRLVVEEAVDGIFLTDNHASLLDVNPSGCRMTGYSKEELLSMSVMDLVPDEDRDVVLQEFSKSMGRKTIRMEHRFRRKDGVLLPVEISGKTLSDGKNLTLVRDITHLKQREHALRESEQKYRLLVESTPNWILIVDRAGVIQYINSSDQNILGRIEGKNINEFIAGDSIQQVSAVMDRLFSGELVGTLTASDIRGEMYHCHFVPLKPEGVVQSVMVIANNITKQKQTESALRESTRRLTGILGAIVANINMVDEEYNVVWANDVAKQIFGSVEGKKCYAVYHRRDQPCPHCIVRETFQDGKPHEQESDAIDKAGNLIELWCTSSVAETGPDGRPKLVIEVSLDVTQRKQTELALRESEERYRLLAENVSDVIWTMDMNLQYTYISPSSELLSGYSVGELLGKSILYSVLPEYQKLVWDVFEVELEIDQKEGVDPNRTRTMEVEQTHKDGTHFWVEVKASFLRDESGKPIGILGVSRDITGRKWSEKALKESETKYRNLVELASDGICIVQDYIIKYANEQLNSFMGTTAKELIGQPFMDYIHNDFSEGLQNLYERHNGGENKLGIVETVIGKPGNQNTQVEINASIIPYQGKPATLVVVRNMSDRFFAERQRTKLEEQLRQTQKMEAIGQLAGGVAHDFNNLLMGVMGGASLLKRHVEKGSQQFKRVRMIEKSAEQAALLTNQLLAFARGGKYQPMVLDLNEVVLEALDFIPTTIKQQVRIDTKMGHNMESIEADRTQLFQILTNLCQNAMDAMNGWGEITIETSAVSPADLPLDLRDTNAFYNALCVWDTGPGISEEEREKIFDPFYTSKDYGRGLGLAAVYGIVRNHHGMIVCDEAPSGGARFTIYFPVQQGPVLLDDSEAKATMSEGSYQWATIMVVDDDKFSRQMTTSMLESIGYRSLQAESGAQALEVAKNNQGRIDLVMLDAILPEIDGEEIWEKIQEIQPHAKVIFMSGVMQEMIMPSGFNSSKTGFLQKPFTVKELGQTLRTFLAVHN